MISLRIGGLKNRLSTSEIMSLVRYFGLLVGYFVPQNKPVIIYYFEKY
jgi:hypothetical protein